MKLLTKEILERFAKVGRQEGEDAVVIAKFFTPWGKWTFWFTEYDPETRTFFGLVQGHETELGYSSLDEIEAVRGPWGLKIERDLHWREKTLAEVRAALEKNQRHLV